MFRGACVRIRTENRGRGESTWTGQRYCRIVRALSFNATGSRIGYASSTISGNLPVTAWLEFLEAR